MTKLSTYLKEIFEARLERLPLLTARPPTGADRQRLENGYHC